jgi:hypothetical protein
MYGNAGDQGCQILLGTIYQNGEKYTKLPLNYQIATKLPNGLNIFQMVIKYTNLFHSKALQNLPKLDFWFENIPSGNPDVDTSELRIKTPTKFVRIRPKRLSYLFEGSRLYMY